MKDLIIWIVHTPAGAVGIAAATVALFTKKGSTIHRRAGACFTISMLIMLLSGFVAAFLKESTGDMFLSVVVTYTVFTAWLTSHRKKGETGFLEKAALGWIIAVGLAAFFINGNWRELSAPNVYHFWAAFAVICAIGDIRNLHRAGLTGIQRVIRHVWRIGFSLLWAALAFTDKIVKILGSEVGELSRQQLLYVVGAPSIFILLITSYWIINISFFSRSKFSSYGR